MTNELIYNTRDGKGNDIVKTVNIKQYQKDIVDFTCMCGKESSEGVNIKKIVSSNFTDWPNVSNYVCEECADMFSLYKYSMIKDAEKTRLLNVREMATEILKPQKPPFIITISTSYKKHLFYLAKTNFNPDVFSVNLETERIECEMKTLKEQFRFVSSMQVLGESKARLKSGEIRNDIFQKVGYSAFKYLTEQLKTRQIQIPLHLSQEPDLSEESAMQIIKEIVNGM